MGSLEKRGFMDIGRVFNAMKSTFFDIKTCECDNFRVQSA